MNVDDLKKLQKNYFNSGSGKEEMLEHLPSMIQEPEILKDRLEQLAICAELDQYYDGAAALLEIKDMFQMRGNFSGIESLLKTVCLTVL